MLTVAYLANEFPSPVEPYVADEISELLKRGVSVVATSVRMSRHSPAGQDRPEIILLPLDIAVIIRATYLCLTKCSVLAPLFARIVFRGKEGLSRRLKAMAHTFLGACYAVRLKGRGVQHIHIHHGYFGSWIGMSAAMFLGVEFSLTLHGSDLLLHPVYLGIKLKACKFCLTISEYNRRYILALYPKSGQKIVVSRLGVEPGAVVSVGEPSRQEMLKILTVGRLHPVKNHAFLITACAHLAQQQVSFHCSIAGEGSERSLLESRILKYGIAEQITLLGHVSREKIPALYEAADVVVLTSQSEGIPLVLMEAMIRGKVVLAPAITGIPELVIPGQTGFLYAPGSMADFLDQLLLIRSLILANSCKLPNRPESPANPLPWIRHAARVHVLHNFNRARNLERFADLFLSCVHPKAENVADENLVLQQV